jgi:hypothetical protein
MLGRVVHCPGLTHKRPARCAASVLIPIYFLMRPQLDERKRIAPTGFRR